MKTIFLTLFSILTILLLQNCAMVKISASDSRNPILQKIDIGENTTLSTWGTVKINKSHFFPSSFQLKQNSTIVYIDPVEVETSDKADYILITHAHPDHLSIKDIRKLLKSTTTIICSKGVASKLKGIDNPIRIVRPGDKLDFEEFGLETIAAYNTRSVFLWIKAHPKSKENVGYILSLKDNFRVYHAGDTDYIPEMKKLKDINLALVPIGGDNLTMNEEEAAKIINEINPEIAVPMHYEIANQDELKRFKSLVNRKTKVIELD